MEGHRLQRRQPARSPADERGAGSGLLVESDTSSASTIISSQGSVLPAASNGVLLQDVQLDAEPLSLPSATRARGTPLAQIRR